MWGIYADNLLATKIYESLTLNIDTDVSDEEARHPVLWYVFVAKYALAEDGSHVPLDEEGLLNVRERAERLAGEAKETADFYGFARENTDDTDEIEIVYPSGSPRFYSHFSPVISIAFHNTVSTQTLVSFSQAE